MSVESAFEREERYLEEQYARGDIDSAEFNRQMRELQRDYSDSAHQAAHDAYERELERW